MMVRITVSSMLGVAVTMPWFFSVVMLKNHGIVTATPSIDETVIRTIMFENAAQIQMIMEAAGDTAAEFPAKDVEQLKHDISRPEQFVVNFDYLVRRAKRREK